MIKCGLKAGYHPVARCHGHGAMCRFIHHHSSANNLELFSSPLEVVSCTKLGRWACSVLHHVSAVPDKGELRLAIISMRSSCQLPVSGASHLALNPHSGKTPRCAQKQSKKCCPASTISLPGTVAHTHRRSVYFRHSSGTRSCPQHMAEDDMFPLVVSMHNTVWVQMEKLEPKHAKTPYHQT